MSSSLFLRKFVALIMMWHGEAQLLLPKPLHVTVKKPPRMIEMIIVLWYYLTHLLTY